MAERLKDKVAIVTGGAKGIGLTIADKFTDEGAKVVVTDIDESAKENVTALNKNDSLKFFNQDVSDSSSWPAVFDFAKENFGTVTTIVNNAGIGITDSIENTSDEEWHKVLGVNLDGVFYGTREGIRRMKNLPNGASIINMASIEALIGDPNLGAYNASKGGTMLLTKSAALDCALNDCGIRVNSVHPGYIGTKLVDDLPGVADAMAKTHQDASRTYRRAQ